MQKILLVSCACVCVCGKELERDEAAGRKPGSHGLADGNFDKGEHDFRSQRRSHC